MKYVNNEKRENNKSFKGNVMLCKRIFSFVIVLVLVTNTMYSGGLLGQLVSNTVLTADAEGETSYIPSNLITDFPGTQHTFGNNDDGKKRFVDYCYYYNTDNTFASAHSGDILEIVFSELPESFSFMGLGNSTVPFAGEMRFIADSNNFSNISLSRALFSHVSTNAKLLNANGTASITLKITKNSNVSSPILANHVYSGSVSADWKVTVDSGNTNDYAGVIGQLEKSAAVVLEFSNDSSAAVSNTASGENDIKDVGSLCGIMKTGSSLTVKDNSSIRPNVSSSSGNAGSLVGKMEGTAALTLNTCPAFSGVSVTTADGYAGGLVGYITSSASISGLASPLAVGGSVTGTSGAGGLFGYYKNNSTGIFDLKDYNITAAVSAENCGGVFGVLEHSKGDSSAAIKLTIKNTGNTGTVNIGSGSSASSGYFGGIAGKYSTDALANSLILDGFSVTAKANASFDSFGGVIGFVDSTSAVYIKADNLTVTSINPGKKDSTAFYGGLVGKTSDTYGVFIDLGDFNLTASNYKGGGVVGNFKNGVLRLSGTTNMASANSVKGGQLVGENDNVLVYALGTGSNGTAYENGWTIKRSSTASSVDDLGTWGEVVRIVNDGNSNKNLEQAGIVSIGTEANLHKVTLSGAEPSNISNTSEFAKTALNIMLNKGNSYGLFTFNSGSKYTTLLSGTLSIDSDISLAGTGINGFMRDGGELSTVENYTGTFNGNSHKITLAAGEKYGYGITSSSTAEGVGQIYRHQHNGLFAVLAGTVQNLTVDGTINVSNRVDGMNIGGIAAVSKGATTLNNVTASQTINYNEADAVSGTEAQGKNIGGLIGLANGSPNGTIAISGTSTINVKINISGNYKDWTCVGAVIGKITSSSFTVDIAQGASDKLTVSHTMSIAAETSAGANADGGGLIGYITSGDYANRKVNINHLDFNNCTIVNKASANGGGFLGYAWLGTDTTIDGLTVTNGTITNTSPNVGVMCYEATGKWTVNNLTVTKMSLSDGAGASFGMLVNKAYNGNNGLYLNVLNSGYTLTDKSGDTGITLPVSLGIYDELAAYSASDAGNVIKGGNGTGVVSVNMNDARGNTGSATILATGTYQNKLTSTSYAALGSAKYANPNTRYYYNLDVMTNSNPDKAQDIMLWSVKQYASQNIKDEFDSSDAPFSMETETTVSLSDYSYYPVYNVSSITLKNINLDFGYSDVYAIEGKSTFNKDSYKRDPSAQNQHYLMQSGLFINSNENTTLTLDSVKFSGDFLENSTYKGVLISGTAKGNISIDGLALDGITPKFNSSGTISNYTGGYLLVNNVNRADTFKANIQLNLKNISTSNKYTDNGTTADVSKSLFGNVYGPAIGINVSGVKLDARSANGGLSALDTAYGTKNSIFTDATLFNSIKTSQAATLLYNYTWEADWGTGNRNVTYGKEVSESVEYVDKENKYYNDSRFTDPTSSSHSAVPEYDFSSWRPYVSTAYTANQTQDSQGCFYREIKVNVPATAYAEGCGTYNDPYIIDSGAKLTAIAALISDGSKTNELPSVQLPKTLYDGVAANTTGSRWCDGKNDHAVYTYNSTLNKYVSSEAGVTAQWSVDNVRLYLANAYYSLTSSTDNANGNIVLGNGFLGLGKSSDDTSGKYVFRGVIVGNGKTIINNSTNPLVKLSNGCVIKDLTVKQSVNVDVKAQDKNSISDAYFGYDSKCEYYGGMIGEIMGGDSIIDNSYVEFGSTTVTLNGTNGTIVPVGGYVGVVVFGGLIFKNIDARKTTLSSTGLKVYYTTNTDNNLAENTAAAKAAIYVNPLVGRVINGYAVNETGGNALGVNGEKVQQFSVTENGTYHDDANSGAGTARSGNQHTLKNGKKHYSIADIDPSLAKLDVTAVPTSTTADGSINVPNAQALFVMSLITQSAAGTAETVTSTSTVADETVETSRETDESGNVTIHKTRTIVNSASPADYSNSLSYGTYSDSVYGMSHNANYSTVGTNESSSSDYDTYINGDTAAKSALPYIIRHYTVGTSSTSTSSNETTNTQSASTEGRIETYSGSDPNGEYIIIKFGSKYLNAGTTKEVGLEAVTSNSSATKLLFTKQVGGENDGKYTISFDNNGTKYLGFNTTGNSDNKRKLVTTTTPYYFNVVKQADGTWRIYGDLSEESRRYIGLRNNTHFTGQSSDNIKLSLEVYIAPSSTSTTTITTTNTTTTTHNYPARCVTSTAGYYDINLTGSSTYQLPDSFRGLGCVGNYNANYCMKVDQFAGAGLTIDEDIYLNKYTTDNYFNKLHNGITQNTSQSVVDYDVGIVNGNNHGIGLFDSIITKDTNSNISCFKLSGSVNTEIYSNLYTASPKELCLPSQNDARFLSVGGVCGTSLSGNNLNFSQIDLISFTANGSSLVGGILGYSAINQDSTAEIHITKCGATDLSVIMSSSSTKETQEKARNAIGGFVGKCYEGKVKIYGTLSGTDNEDTDDFSTVTFKDFKFENASADYRAAAGGLVGFAGDGCQVYDMKIVSGNSSDPVSIGGDGIRFVGGICGLMQSAKDGTNKDNQPYTPTCYAIFKNCTVENINFKGQFVGGFYGGKWGTTGWTTYSIDIDNCKVKGDSAGNNTIEAVTVYVSESQYAGGFVGRGLVLENGTPNIRIKDSIVSNYTITGTYCGGFIGYTGSYKDDSSITCYIHDSSVEDCIIGTGDNYAGGAIGQVYRNSASSANRILGYNIKLDHVTSNSSNMGAWIGYVDSSDNTTSIQFTGVGIYGTGFEQNVGNRSNFSNASFVFADYTGACNGTIPDGETETVYPTDVSTFNASGNVAMPKHPYVNINPQSSMGGDEIISSDGAVLYGQTVTGYNGTGKNTVAAKIYSEMGNTGTSRQYYTTYNSDNADVVSGTKIDAYMKRSMTDDGDRISTYYLEKGITSSDAPGYDNFACIVIANNVTDETTALINRYAQLVTNTTTDYAGTDNSDSYFDIVVRSCKLQNGQFVIDTSATPGLNYDSTTGKFSMNSDSADSQSSVDTFTLVDIQFKDPLHTQNIAYHLYIPVYTIKEIEVEFSAAVLNGTNSVSYNVPAGTENANGYAKTLNLTTSDTHVDSLNTWYTTYIRYTYGRGDLQALLDTGNLNWNHNKYFYFDKTGFDATSLLPADTYMVLVDPNGDHDKQYKVSLNTTDFPRVNTRISFDLTSFKDSNNNPFSVSTFNEMIAKKIVAAQTGGYYNLYTGTGTPSNTGRTHYVYTKASDGTPTYYEYVGNGGAYSLTLPNDYVLNENYYISMYVPKPESGTPLYGYFIRTPEKYDAPSYPSGTNNATAKSAKVNCHYGANTTTENRQVYIGNMFTQETELTVLPHDQEIDAGNKTLNVYAKTTITPIDPNVATILNSINADIHHSFNIFLDRKGENGLTTNNIYGLYKDYDSSVDNDDVQAWYNIGEAIPQDPNADMSGYTRIAQSSIDLQSSYINVATGTINRSGTVIYSRIQLDFATADLVNEFPQKVANDTGVSVRGASNLAYDSDSLAFSSMSEPVEELPDNKHIYYRQSMDTAELSYNAENELDSYDTDGQPSENYSRLGISGKYSMNEIMPVNTVARYNIYNILNAAEDAQWLSLSLTLQKKTDTPAVGTHTAANYQNVTSINDYWGAVMRDGTNEVAEDGDGKPTTETGTNVRIKCGNYDQVVTVPAGSTSVDVRIPKNALNAAGYTVDENGYIYIYIGFNAKTGENFSEYANYKVNLKARLLDGSNIDIAGSYDDDYIIYTNAKVNHDFLKYN